MDRVHNLQEGPSRAPFRARVPLRGKGRSPVVDYAPAPNAAPQGPSAVRSPRIWTVGGTRCRRGTTRASQKSK